MPYRRNSRFRDPRALTLADLPSLATIATGHPALSALEDHRLEVGAEDTVRRKRVRKPSRRLEEHEQAILFAWADLSERRYPDLRWLHSIPNEGDARGGKAGAIEGARRKRLGRKSGVLDIDLPVSRGGYLSLRIEMKVAPNKPSADQVRWICGLIGLGHCVCVCYSAEEAKRAVIDYLEGRMVRHP